MKTTIEINGKIYDAHTGKVVSSHPAKTDTSNAERKTPTRTQVTQPLQRGVIMDGVRKTPHHATNRPLSSAQPTPVKHVQKSQTLHRKAVHKPSTPKPVPHIHSTNANVHSSVEHSATGRGMLVKRVPDVRLSRALRASKSTLISKFGTPPNPKPHLTTELPVKEPPVHHQAPKSTHSSAGATTHQTKPVNTQPTTTSKETPANPKKFVFEDHIKKANSHLLKPVKKDSRRKRLVRSLKISPKVVSASAAVFALTLLAGFFAYQNVPMVSMRVAASKAGFNGALPSNIPAGYSFNGPVQADKDVISLTYNSNSDARRFIEKKKPSNWSSEALLTNYLLDSQFRYQAYKDNGLTIYIYNGSNATWVDKGIWYSVNGEDGSLSSEQLLELASSM